MLSVKLFILNKKNEVLISSVSACDMLAYPLVG